MLNNNYRSKSASEGSEFALGQNGYWKYWNHRPCTQPVNALLPADQLGQLYGLFLELREEDRR